MQIGIDLGTTSVSAAIYDNYAVNVLVPKGDQCPSCVARVQDHYEVGRKALNKQLDPRYVTIDNLKRRVMKEETLGCRTVLLIKLLLKEVKELAEEKLQHREQFTEATVGIPNDFGIAQRRVYREALREAFFENARIVSEPAAAMIGYQYQQAVRKPGRYLIIDYGGGTADVTIGRWETDSFFIEYVLGDNNLGGRDLDEVMVQLIYSEYQHQFAKTLPFSLHSLKLHNLITYYRMREIARQVKESLSDQNEAIIHEIIEGVPIDGLIITRELFERAAIREFNTVKNLVQRALKSAQVTPEMIDFVLLTGGSCRIPGVRKHLSALLDPHEANKIIFSPKDATTLVTEGLAFLSAHPNRYTLHDIYPHDIGLELNGDRIGIVPIIKQGDLKTSLDAREVRLNDQVDLDPNNSTQIKIIVSEARFESNTMILQPLAPPFQIDLQKELGITKEAYTNEIVGEFLFEPETDKIEFDFRFENISINTIDGNETDLKATQFVDSDAIYELKQKLTLVAQKLGVEKGKELWDIAETLSAEHTEIDDYLRVVDLLAVSETGG